MAIPTHATRRSARYALAALALVAISEPVLSAAQQSSQPASGRSAADVMRPQIELPGTEGSAATRSGYVIGPEDQIVVRVAENPDLSDKPQRVDGNGEIRLPMIGRVQAAGLTPQQLEASLTEKFKVFIVEPDVMVAVVETRSQPVSVIGAVAQPGVRQLDGTKTLMQMLLTAGGAAPDAGPTVTVTRRLDTGRTPLAGGQVDPTGQFSTAQIPLRPLLEGRAPATDLVLQPNDVVTVSKAEMVFVIGEVGKAGPLPLVNGNSISVLEAVSAAGGLQRTAAGSNARILRSTPGAEARVDLPVDLKRMLAGKARDVVLLPGDILVVPDSASKRAVTRALEAAIQLGMAVGTYGLIR